MGTDIHGVVQEKRNGKWKDVQKIPFVRSYDTFSVLFGVTETAKGTPVAEYYGLPDDFDGYEHDLDYHSRTWMDGNDVRTYDWNQTFEDTRGKTDMSYPSGPSMFVTAWSLLNDEWKDLIGKMKKHEPPENIRVVVWFDC